MLHTAKDNLKQRGKVEQRRGGEEEGGGGGGAKHFYASPELPSSAPERPAAPLRAAVC